MGFFFLKKLYNKNVLFQGFNIFVKTFLWKTNFFGAKSNFETSSILQINFSLNANNCRARFISYFINF